MPTDSRGDQTWPESRPASHSPARFLHRFDAKEAWRLSNAWRPSQPTLIIADYASAQVETIAALAAQLHDQVPESGPPVRLLLLERMFDQVFEERFMRVGASQGDSGAIRQYRVTRAPLAVPALTDDEPPRRATPRCASIWR